MEDWRQRIFDEQKELGIKIRSLISFITDYDKTFDLLPQDLDLLRQQLNIMLEYDMILQKRM